MNLAKEKIKKLSDLEEQAFAVIFTSIDQGINYPMVCKSSDIFSKLEEKLYLEYSKYKKPNNFFTANGRIINKHESLEKNGIKNGTYIILNNDDE